MHTRTQLSACRIACARSYDPGNQVQSIGNVKNHFFYLTTLCSLLFSLSSLALCVSIYITFSLVLMYAFILCRSNRWFSLGISSTNLSNRPQSRIQPVHYNGNVINEPPNQVKAHNTKTTSLINIRHVAIFKLKRDLFSF